MAGTPYKFYAQSTNGIDYPMILPGTNTPFGAREISLDEFTKIAKNTGQYDKFANDPTYGPMLQGQTVGSGLSWGTDPQTGQQGWGNWDQINADQAKDDAAVAAGTEQKVKVGNGFGYVPTGSAAANTINNPALGNTGSNGPAGTFTPSGSGTSGSQGTGTSGGNGGQGAGTGGTGTTGSGGLIQPMDTKQYRDLLQSKGVDISQLSDQQINALGAMQQVVNANAVNDGKIAPPSNSATDMQNYLNQATAQIDPAYQDQFKMATQDALQQIDQLNGTNTQNEQLMKQQFDQQLQDTQNQYAEAGLAQSGLRKKAEDQLATQQQGMVQSNRRQIQNQVYSLGSQLERMYGTKAAGLYPQIQSQALAGQPATTIGYKPVGVQYPTAQQNEQIDITNRQTQLAQQGAANKNFLQTGTYTQI